MAATLMAIMSGAQAVNSVSGAYAQSQARRAQGAYEKNQLETNQRLAEMQAEDAVKRGDEASHAEARAARKAIGTQRAVAAAMGNNPDSGSMADITAETALQSDINQTTIKANAWREAWGYRVQANQYGTGAQMAWNAADFEARQTLLSGGMKALGHLGDVAGTAYKSSQDRERKEADLAKAEKNKTPERKAFNRTGRF